MSLYKIFYVGQICTYFEYTMSILMPTRTTIVMPAVTPHPRVIYLNKNGAKFTSLITLFKMHRQIWGRGHGGTGARGHGGQGGTYIPLECASV